MTGWEYNDGGRAAAGYKGSAGDCVARSIAIATQQPYQVVYDALKTVAQSERPRDGRRSSVRDGVRKTTIRRYMASIGWEWVPTMRIGSGCKVHLRADELPGGRLVVSVSKHLTAVVNGVIHDTHDPRRGAMFNGAGEMLCLESRCVYGYWFEPGRPRK